MAAASKAIAALVLSLNLVFFTMVTASTCPNGLAICADVLGMGFLGIRIGPSTGSDCCAPYNGLVDAQVAVCLCNALRTGTGSSTLLDALKLNIVVNAVLGYCGRPEIPSCLPYIHP